MTEKPSGVVREGQPLDLSGKIVDVFRREAKKSPWKVFAIAGSIVSIIFTAGGLWWVYKGIPHRTGELEQRADLTDKRVGTIETEQESHAEMHKQINWQLDHIVKNNEFQTRQLWELARRTGARRLAAPSTQTEDTP